MRLVIDIPEEYRAMFENDKCKYMFDTLATNDFGYWLRKGFENGTPLPEHYGRLLMLDEERVNANSMKVGDWSCQKWISEVGISNSVVAIIPATKPPRWIERRLQMGLHDWMCSVCKCQCEDTVKVCPNCGVDTDGRYEMEEDDGGYWFKQREEQTATKEKQTERKCESCKYHDGSGGCLDSCALCRYTPKQTATKEAESEAT